MNLKIGAFIQSSGSREQTLGEIRQRSSSKGYIIYVHEICLNSVPCGPINFILGADIRTTPTSMAQNGFHGNIGCLASGQRNLQFMIEYIKHRKAYKLQNRHTSLRCRSGNMIQFL